MRRIFRKLSNSRINITVFRNTSEFKEGYFNVNKHITIYENLFPKQNRFSLLQFSNFQNKKNIIQSIINCEWYVINWTRNLKQIVFPHKYSNDKCTYIRYIFGLNYITVLYLEQQDLLNLTLTLSRKLETARFFAVDEFNALVTIDDLLFNNTRIMQLTFICRFLISIIMLHTIGVSIRELNIDNKTILVTACRN